MSDTKLLRAIINGQSALKEELLGKIDKLDKKIDEVKIDLKFEIKDTRESLTERIDKLGLQLAELSDEAPTIEKFDKLDTRVKKLESQTKN